VRISGAAFLRIMILNQHLHPFFSPFKIILIMKHFLTLAFVFFMLSAKAQDYCEITVNCFFPTYIVSENDTISIADTSGIAVSNGDTLLLHWVYFDLSVRPTIDGYLPIDSAGHRYVISCKDAPLPAELTNFDAYPGQSGNVLIWETASEENVKEFVVEQSDNGNNWRVIGLVEAQGASDYRFDHERPFTESYYRLKVVDEDGSFEYSYIVSVVRHQDEPPYMRIQQGFNLVAPVFDLSGAYVANETKYLPVGHYIIFMTAKGCRMFVY
jgi:hypothetical protein